jgi:hypothetical protein
MKSFKGPTYINLDPDKDHRGFVMPAIILTMIVLSALAVAAVLMSSDERSSASAMLESAAAFYAAEAGLNQVPSIVSDVGLGALQPYETLDLGWRTLEHGASYRAIIRRLDEGIGGQTLYRLTVEGRGEGPRGGQRIVSHAFSYSPYPTMDAAAKVRGRARLEDGSEISGHDVAPDGWSAAGLCTDPEEDKPGLIIEDIDDLELWDDSDVDGVPDVVEDPSINDGTFRDFDGPTWDDLIGLADHVIGTYGTWDEDDDGKVRMTVQPSYNDDGSCNTDDPYNWGSNDPNDPCFDYFPVIYLEDGGMRTNLGDGYGQAFLITDSEFDLQASDADGDATGLGVFAGIILSRGCFEINMSQHFYGAVIHDRTDHSSCGDNEKGIWMQNEESLHNPEVHYSSCAVARAIKNSRVGNLFGWHLLTRPFEEVLR